MTPFDMSNTPASQTDAFWRTVRLEDMSKTQWESLCDGCGRCCLQKLEDEDTGEVCYTALSCRHLDTDSCRCKIYPQRATVAPECIHLTINDIPEFHWLPSTCAYRLVSEGKDLPEWHPLVSGTPETVHLAGISVQQRVMSEDRVPEDDWEEYIIHWID